MQLKNMQRCLKHIAQKLCRTRVFSNGLNGSKEMERTWKVVK